MEKAQFDRAIVLLERNIDLLLRMRGVDVSSLIMIGNDKSSCVVSGTASKGIGDASMVSGLNKVHLLAKVKLLFD